MTEGGRLLLLSTSKPISHSMLTLYSLAILTKTDFFGDLLFTDNGISGPVVYELSSYNARKEFPYDINVDFINKKLDLQKEFNNNPHKNLYNLLSIYLPKSLINEITEIDLTQKCHAVRSNTKVLINSTLRNYKLTVTGTRKDGETVTCGGVSLKETDSRTMQSKKISDLYFCGEVLDADGLCGGYNLQFCWSSGYIVSKSINYNH